jgi:NitT/TauT family transport system ATP-binding protein
MAGKGLDIGGLSVSYGERRVLEDVNLSVRSGEFVAIVGKSGCGKTTLLNAISGFVPYCGKIEVSDSVGMVFQDHAIFPWMTVEANVSFGMQCRDSARYLEMIGMSDKALKYPFELSGGERQRVALARALAGNSNLILMDEPYGSLDVFTRAQMQRWLLDLWEKERKTILFVTHSIEEAVLLADRVLVMKGGRISREFRIALGRPRDKTTVFTKKFVDYVRHITVSLSD